jgi:arsenite-transporting ATPase
MGKAQKLLTDPELTAFFFVTLAEALPIAVITRFIGWFQDFGIPVGGVIVNMLIDRSQVTSESPEFVHNRVDMQSRYMDDIWEKFEGMVRSIVPLYETEVRGTTSLVRMGDALFA